jgi:branched-chain amino acid transport system permease protein
MRITQGYYLIVYAILVMAMMQFCPSGILGLIERGLNAASRTHRPAPTLEVEGAEP